jgi:hypothetical protein
MRILTHSSCEENIYKMKTQHGYYFRNNLILGYINQTSQLDVCLIVSKKKCAMLEKHIRNCLECCLHTIIHTFIVERKDLLRSFRKILMP